ncbi:alpha/beta hydrolase [Actinomadura graeca]|uniref:Alpha/beta hydrolase n=1 Tax=Actinomadura graeca TaxID=2750812 RepID=A0ABX8R6J3_9ACTN|nr:alpha/beta hydrolase [Actinomadura graeca]QXJ26141.1 alpha/beta hydrolase [Actinomadura graeca]
MTTTRHPAGLSVPVADGVRLHVRHLPAAGGRPFLLLHGLMSNARLWDEVAERLADAGHPVYAVDLRGHGESDVPEGGYDTATAVADVAAAVTALGLDGMLVAGHSWGGHIGVRLADEHPSLVEGLALVDGGWFEFAFAFAREFEFDPDAPYDSLEKEFREAMRKSVSAPVSVDQMRGYLRGLHPEWSETAIEARLRDMRAGPDGVLTPRLSEPQCLSIVRSIVNDSPARHLPGVAVPVLLVPALPGTRPWWERHYRDAVDRAERLLCRPTVKWYLGADHHLHADRPGELARDLLGLARGTAPAAG